MNVAAHQKKNKNTGQREARQEKRLVTDFKENSVQCCCSEGAARQKSSWMRKVPGVTGTLWKKANSLFDTPQMGSGTAPPR